MTNKSRNSLVLGGSLAGIGVTSIAVKPSNADGFDVTAATSAITSITGAIGTGVGVVAAVVGGVFLFSLASGLVKKMVSKA